MKKILANADKVSVDAAGASVLSELGGVFSIKVVSVLLRTGFGKNLVEHLAASRP